jgi:excisionase family DNA binding protein
MDTSTLPQRRVLRVEEAAELLGVGRSLVYDLIREKRLRSFKVGSRRLIPVAAIDELVAALAGLADG